MTQSMSMEELSTTAEVILYLNAKFPGHLPKTTVTMLTRGIKPHADLVMQTQHLREAIRRAEIHAAKFEVALAEDAEFEQLLAEEAAMNAQREPIVTMCDEAYLALIDLEDRVVEAKLDKFEAFLDKLDGLKARGTVEQLQEWLRDAKQRVLQYSARRPQPRALVAA